MFSGDDDDDDAEGRRSITTHHSAHSIWLFQKKNEFDFHVFLESQDSESRVCETKLHRELIMFQCFRSLQNGRLLAPKIGNFTRETPGCLT